MHECMRAVGTCGDRAESFRAASHLGSDDDCSSGVLVSRICVAGVQRLSKREAILGICSPNPATAAS